MTHNNIPVISPADALKAFLFARAFIIGGKNRESMEGYIALLTSEDGEKLPTPPVRREYFGIINATDGPDFHYQLVLRVASHLNWITQNKRPIEEFYVMWEKLKNVPTPTDFSKEIELFPMKEENSLPSAAEIRERDVQKLYSEVVREIKKAIPKTDFLASPRSSFVLKRYIFPKFSEEVARRVKKDHGWQISPSPSVEGVNGYITHFSFSLS